MQMHRLLFTIRELNQKLSSHQIYTDFSSLWAAIRMGLVSTWQIPFWCLRRRISAICLRLVSSGKGNLTPWTPCWQELKSPSGPGIESLKMKYCKSDGFVWNLGKLRKSKRIVCLDVRLTISIAFILPNIYWYLLQVHILCTRPFKNWNFTRGINNLCEMPWWLGSETKKTVWNVTKYLAQNDPIADLETFICGCN